MDTETWLEDLGLSQYLQTFVDNDLDWETLPTLDASDLKEIGIQSLGHRKKLLQAIAVLLKPAELTQSDGAEPANAAPNIAESERRQVSVMFCDLVGSTELSTKLDAEDVDALIRAYQEAITPIVHEFEGHVARFAGDGILCYFGYPHANEFEAESAVRAALKAVAVTERSSFHPGISSQVRIGIATGDVVIGGLFDKGNLYEAMATGETPNLAARLQGLAQPGGIVVCDVTQQLAGQLIYFEDLGAKQLKGFDRQKRAWQVTGKAPGRDKFWAGRSAHSWSSLAGRQGEIATLMSGWRRAQGARGGSVLITGEAGVGKSRLFSVLLENITESERIHMKIYCEQYYRNTPLYPFISFFNAALNTSPEDPGELRRERLEEYLRDYCDQPDRIIPFVARMLDIPGYESHPALEGMSPQRIRETTMEVGVSLLQYGAQNLPILISVEDLHWADPTTLAFLEKLAEAVSSQPIFLVMTARPDLVLGWSTVSPQILNLSKLNHDQIEGIVEEAMGERTLPENIVLQICEKSDGIPLYAEELTKSILSQYSPESDGSGGSRDFTVPSALQSGLLARLDKLSGTKEFALLCSVIGREFTAEFASMICGTELEQAEQALQSLVEAEILDVQPGLSPPRFVFRHMLLRDAAYGHLLRARRRELHFKLASLLELNFPNTVSNEPELLAHHFTNAERIPEAVQYWLKAGQRALIASANIEAADHLNRGLGLLARMDKNTPHSLGMELELQMTLGPALTAVKGFAAPEVKNCFSRSRVLCDTIGVSGPVFPAMRGLMSFYAVRADYELALDLGSELEAMVTSGKDSGQQLELAWVMGSASLFSGDLGKAMPLFEKAISLYRPEDHAVHAMIYGQDPGVAALTHYFVGLTLQCRYDESVAVGEKALKLSKQLNHPFTTAQAASFLQSALYIQGDYEALLKLSTENLAFCQQQGFPVFMALSMVYNGWCKAFKGDSSGAELTQQGIDIYAMSGAESGKPGFLVTLAECYLNQGQPDRALESLEKHKKGGRKTGKHVFSAAMLEIKARAMLLQNFEEHYSEAQGLLLESIAMSRVQEAAHYELVALTTLLGMLRRTGQDESGAYTDLHSLYHRHGQGIDYKPMREARKLLH